MEKERSIDRLARYIIIIGTIVLAVAACYFFSSVLAYILLAFVVSLIGQPVIRLLRRIKIKGKTAPDADWAVITLVIIFAMLFLVIMQVIPVVTGIVGEASLMNAQESNDSYNIIDQTNDWIIQIGRIIGALVPDSIESRVEKTILDIVRLLSRYFVGLIVEILGVVILNCLGLWLIARIDFNYAIGIAFIAGLLNIIPYVGPLIGELIGVVLCVILKYGAGIGLGVNI